MKTVTAKENNLVPSRGSGEENGHRIQATVAVWCISPANFLPKQNI